MSSNTVVGRGLRLIDPTSDAERKKVASTMMTGGPAATFDYMATGSVGQGDPMAGMPKDPSKEYDVADEMVQASRRLAAQRATQGFGLARTFITRTIDQELPPDRTNQRSWDTANPNGVIGKKNLDGDVGGAGSGAPATTTKPPAAAKPPVVPTIPVASRIGEDPELLAARRLSASRRMMR